MLWHPLQYFGHNEFLVSCWMNKQFYMVTKEQFLCLFILALGKNQAQRPRMLQLKDGSKA